MRFLGHPIVSRLRWSVLRLPRSLGSPHHLRVVGVWCLLCVVGNYAEITPYAP